MALRALAEIDIDASAHASKGFGDVPLETMDLVITLCADEVCPEIGGGAQRLHWPLPDPAAATGDDAAQLASFRSVRDEIRRRLEDLFSADRAAARP